MIKVDGAVGVDGVVGVDRVDGVDEVDVGLLMSSMGHRHFS